MKKYLLGIEDGYSRIVREKIIACRERIGEFKQYLMKRDIGRASIYGFGRIGRDLRILSEESETEISCIIDKNDQDRFGKRIIGLECYNYSCKELIIVTADFTEATNELVHKCAVPHEQIRAVGAFMDDFFISESIDVSCIG